MIMTVTPHSGNPIDDDIKVSGIPIGWMLTQWACLTPRVHMNLVGDGKRYLGELIVAVESPA